MKRTAILLLILSACLALSCSKEENNSGTGAGTAVLGISVKDLPEIVEVPENQTKTFELTVTSNPGPSAALNISVGTDESLVAKYNLTNGKSYEMLPASAYEISSTPLMLMKYNKVSVPGTLKLKGMGCEIDKTYLLPLVVEQVKGTAAYEAPEDKVVYVIFKMLKSELGGSGTETDPYLISDVESFNKMGNTLKDGETVYLKLTADIDFEGAAWTTIDTEGRAISLDGDGHKVCNVKAAAGLFRILEGSVSDLIIDAATIEAGAELAGVLAERGATGVVVRNVTITNSSITNTGYTGGLLGRLTEGTIEDVNVAVTVSGNERTAGLIGHVVAGTLTRCVATGDVTGTGYYTGGLVAMFANGTVTECSASGAITNTRDNYSRAGGLIGQMFGGTLVKCHATGNVSGTGHYAGGLVGAIDGMEREGEIVTSVKDISISKCYATGNVTLPESAELRKSGSGGLVGITEGGNVTISNCYATGAIKAYRWSSGFVGALGNSTVTIEDSYTSSDCSGITLVKDGIDQFGLVVGNTSAADPGNNKPLGSAKCSGFVAWNLSDKAFCFPADVIPLSGNYYGTEGTISSQAKALGWDETIWDLSGDVPVLK